MNIGFLGSHNGSNMQAILDACAAGALQARPAVVVSNNSGSGVLARAARLGIPHYHLSGKSFATPEALDEAILEALERHAVDIVVLAGYMKKLGAKTLARYSGAILNVHPSLLPKFGGQGMYGEHVHRAVLAAGETESGATVHLVDADYDTGPVLAQARVPVMPGDTAETLAARVLQQEHRLFPDTLEKIRLGAIAIPGYAPEPRG